MVAGLDRTRGACTRCPDQLTSIGLDLSRCVLLNHLDGDGPKQIYLQLQTQLIFIENTMSISPRGKTGKPDLPDTELGIVVEKCFNNRSLSKIDYFIEDTVSIPPEVKQESRIYRIQNSALLLRNVVTTVHYQI